MHDFLLNNINKELSSLKKFNKYDIYKTQFFGDWHLFFQVKKGKLKLLKEKKSFQSRNKATIDFFSQVCSFKTISDCKFFVNTDDYCKSPNYPIFCVCRKKYSNEKLITYPDFTFTSWPENIHWKKWDESIGFINSIDSNIWKLKRNELFFRGSYKTAKFREDFASLYDYYNGSSSSRLIMDIKSSDCTNTKDLQAVPILEHYKWKYLLHMAGRSYASRLKWLMLMNSLVFFYHRENPYVEFWYNALIDGKNCVELVPSNLKELPEILNYYKNNEEKAKKIASEGKKTIEKIDLQTIFKYTEKLLFEYSNLF